MVARRACLKAVPRAAKMADWKGPTTAGHSELPRAGCWAFHSAVRSGLMKAAPRDDPLDGRWAPQKAGRLGSQMVGRKDHRLDEYWDGPKAGRLVPRRAAQKAVHWAGSTDAHSAGPMATTWAEWKAAQRAAKKVLHLAGRTAQKKAGCWENRLAEPTACQRAVLREQQRAVCSVGQSATQMAVHLVWLKAVYWGRRWVG